MTYDFCTGLSGVPGCLQSVAMLQNCRIIAVNTNKRQSHGLISLIYGLISVIFSQIFKQFITAIE